MASNRLPNAIDAVFVQAEAAADGLKVHESSVGILQNTESKLRADLAAARAASSAALAASNAAKDSVIAQSRADADARIFIATARNVLVPYLGSRWSRDWAATGFPRNSTAVPRLVAERQSLIGALCEYFTAQPKYENAPLGVTAARAAELFNALRTARAAANASISAASQAGDAFAAAKVTLRARMAGLIFELRQLMGTEDSRWYAFGLSRPVDPDRPGVPKNLKITSGQPGAVYAVWSPAPRATRYRVYVKEAGETEFAAQLSTWEPSAVVPVQATAASGGSVWIQVSAVNDAGESMPGRAVEMVFPPVTLAGMAA